MASPLTLQKNRQVVSPVTFIVPGYASPMKRPRTTLRGGYVHTYVPDPLGFKGLVWGKAREAGLRPQEGPMQVDVVLYRVLPAHWSRRKKSELAGQPCGPRTPDGVNVLASIWDGLQGAAYTNDSQVAFSSIKRYWAAGFEEEDWTLITVTALLGENHV